MHQRRYAVILGNLGNTRDRYCGNYKQSIPALDMLRAAVGIPHVSGIELVGTWDIRTDNARDVKRALGDAGLACVSIIPDLFSDRLYARGSLSSADHRVRATAMDHVRAMCAIAEDLGCGLINVWPGQDGYDYLLTSDYAGMRERMCHAVAQLAHEFPQTRFALEYKPREPRTHSLPARVGDALLLAQQTGCATVGVTIDTGHAFAAHENAAESAVLAHRAGNRLFHMHFNDNYGIWDDDMIVGSVHTIAFVEALFWLDRIGYDGWLSMDQYPYREDAAAAISESIEWVVCLDDLQRAHRDEMDALVEAGDPVSTSRFMRSMLTPAIRQPA
jgi:sugar phosphate isomerase/epimerase